MRYFAWLIGPALLLTSCATTVNGTTEDVCIQSKPSEADLYVDGIAYGKTPRILPLDRRTSHVVRIELEGYEPQEFFLKNELSGWSFGNLALAPLTLFVIPVGVAVDACSGGIYKLSSDQVVAKLQKK